MFRVVAAVAQVCNCIMSLSCYDKAYLHCAGSSSFPRLGPKRGRSLLSLPTTIITGDKAIVTMQTLRGAVKGCRSQCPIGKRKTRAWMDKKGGGCSQCRWWDCMESQFPADVNATYQYAVRCPLSAACCCFALLRVPDSDCKSGISLTLIISWGSIVASPFVIASPLALSVFIYTLLATVVPVHRCRHAKGDAKDDAKDWEADTDRTRKTRVEAKEPCGASAIEVMQSSRK
jgi:hypothetical protein